MLKVNVIPEPHVKVIYFIIILPAYRNNQTEGLMYRTKQFSSAKFCTWQSRETGFLILIHMHQERIVQKQVEI